MPEVWRHCLLGLTALSLLAACRPPPPEDTFNVIGPLLVFNCAGLAITVQHGEEEVWLGQGGSRERLPQVMAASGARYEMPGYLYWNRGESAMIRFQDADLGTCHRDSLREPLNPLGQGAVDFRARGNEPGWLLEISEGLELTLLLDYGARRLRLPHVPPTPVGDQQWRYELNEQPDGLLAIHLQHRDCTDNMSGEPFTHQVRLEFDQGASLLGCGGAPAILNSPD